MTNPELKDGDIFSWVYTDERLANHAKFWGERSSYLYHCKSRIATFKDGILRDTYWGSSHDGSLNPSEVILTWRGNINNMTVIPAYESEFYKPEDVVDMRHANSSNDLVFRKPGTSRDLEAMRAYYARKIEDAKREASWAISRQEECRASLARIDAGDVTGSFPMWRK